MILPGIMKIMQKISEICRTRKIIAVTVLPHNRKLRWKKINTNSITTAIVIYLSKQQRQQLQHLRVVTLEFGGLNLLVVQFQRKRGL